MAIAMAWRGAGPRCEPLLGRKTSADDGSFTIDDGIIVRGRATGRF